MSTYAMSLSKAIALVGLMVFTSATVRAQTSVVTVAPGQKTQLAEAKQTINVTTPPTTGTVAQDGTQPRITTSNSFTANTEISIDLVGVDNGAQVIQRPWGPVTVADGAIIDLEMEL